MSWSRPKWLCRSDWSSWAALLARSLQTTIGAQPDLGNLLVVDIDVSRLGYDGPATRRLAADLAARLSIDKRVQGVAYSDQSLFSGLSLGILPPGDTGPSMRIRADPVHVTPDDVAGMTVVIDSSLASQLAGALDTRPFDIDAININGSEPRWPAQPSVTSSSSS